MVAPTPGHHPAPTHHPTPPPASGPCRCVYSVRLMAGRRAITADHGGYVRLWGVDEAAVAGAPTLAALPAFAPSVEDPAAAMVDPGVGGSKGGALGLRLMAAGGQAGGSQAAAHATALSTAAQRAQSPLGRPCSPDLARSGGAAPTPFPLFLPSPTLRFPGVPHLLQGGPPRPVGMHCLDACLTHVAVAGRDSVVRLYTYE